MNPLDFACFLSETSSPLIHQFSQLLVTRYSELGDVFFQLIISSKTIPGFLNFIVTYSPLISTLIAICHDAIDKKLLDTKLIAFIEYLNLATIKVPEFGLQFSKSFQESIIQPLIIKHNKTQ